MDANRTLGGSRYFSHCFDENRDPTAWNSARDMRIRKVERICPWHLPVPQNLWCQVRKHMKAWTKTPEETWNHVKENRGANSLNQNESDQWMTWDIKVEARKRPLVSTRQSRGRLRETHQRANEPTSQRIVCDGLRSLSSKFTRMMKLNEIDQTVTQMEQTKHRKQPLDTRHNSTHVTFPPAYGCGCGCAGLAPISWRSSGPWMCPRTSDRWVPRHSPETTWDNLRQLKNAGNIWKPQKSSFNFGQVELYIWYLLGQDFEFSTELATCLSLQWCCWLVSKPLVWCEPALKTNTPVVLQHVEPGIPCRFNTPEEHSCRATHPFWVFHALPALIQDISRYSSISGSVFIFFWGSQALHNLHITPRPPKAVA